MTIEFVKEVLFKNWTTKDFTYSYDKTEYTFAAGGSYRMPSDVAVHFAKHLAIRELHSSGDPRDEALPEIKMNDYQARCFPDTKPGVSSGTFERVDIKDTPATEVKVPEVNKTDATVQNDEDDNDDASDDKNNAGAPVFKSKARKSKDAGYVK